ncbi:MAG: sigma-54 interaction domain-containing protein [Vicinamibacteraceae bacterium]
MLDYLTKPIDLDRLRALLVDIARTRGLPDEIGKLKAEIPAMGGIGQLVGTSRPMDALYSVLCRVAPTNATVLVVGESGVGKEVVARTIHDLSRRRHGPFVAVNCGAIPSSLMESELFGHERGSFTGADRRHKGYFERAAHGTLLLDELTEMPVTLQVKLLRALETRSFTRVGGELLVPTDVRVIATTNRNADEAVRQGALREDLYYRLKVFQLYVPPLRDRSEDIDRLATYVLRQLEASEGAAKRLTPETVERLRAYHWPGNVRELRNVMYSAYLLAHDEITPECLPPELAAGCAGMSVFDGTSVQVAVGMTVSEVERRLILATLSHCRRSKIKAAAMLGVSLKTLYNRLNKYDARSDADTRSHADPLDDE